MNILKTLVVISLFSFTAKAETTAFSTFGPNGEYVTTSVYSLSNPVAFAFTTEQSGMLSEIKLALLQAPESGTTGFSLSLIASADGKPADTLWSSQAIATEGFPLTTVSITNSSIHLQAGTTYWLAAQADTGQFLGWFNSAVEGQAAFWNPVRRSWNNPSPATMSAFAIEVSAIPEPRVGAALILSLLVILLVKRRAAFSR